MRAGFSFVEVRHLAVAEEIEDLLLGHQDIVPAAIHCRARLHDHIALAAIALGCCTTSSPHTTPQPCSRAWCRRSFSGVVVGLRDEVGRAHHLAGEIVVLDERLEVAGFADGLCAVLVFAAHALALSVQFRRVVSPTRASTGTPRRRRMRRKHGTAPE